jgi:hypothetical protein
LVGFALAGVAGAFGWVWFASGWEAIGKLAAVITGVLGVLGAVARWWPRRGVTIDADAALEALAVAVRRQWEAEQTLRRLADPRPLPLRWAACEHDGVMDYGEVICGVAGRETPIDLDGCLDEIVEVFERIPSHRLVVLGEPGAGKSVLAMHFIVATLRGRVAGDPVPVLFPVASWNPREAGLSTWMVSRLCVDYPFLGGRVASGATLAGDLVQRGEIWPVLDGLDEAPEPVRGEVITALNRTLSDKLRQAARQQGRGRVLSARHRADAAWGEQVGADLYPPADASGGSTVCGVDDPVDDLVGAGCLQRASRRPGRVARPDTFRHRGQHRRPSARPIHPRGLFRRPHHARSPVVSRRAGPSAESPRRRPQVGPVHEDGHGHGWEQLGTNDKGENLTLVDFLAKYKPALDALLAGPKTAGTQTQPSSEKTRHPISPERMLHPVTRHPNELDLWRV